ISAARKESPRSLTLRWIVIGGDGAAGHARERAYDAANDPLCKRNRVPRRMDPPGKPRGGAVWGGRGWNRIKRITPQRRRARTPPCTAPPAPRLRLHSRLGRKAQPARGLERLDVEGADLDRAAHIERHRDAVLGHRRADDARALRQQRGHVRRSASL